MFIDSFNLLLVRPDVPATATAIQNTPKLNERIYSPWRCTDE